MTFKSTRRYLKRMSDGETFNWSAQLAAEAGFREITVEENEQLNRRNDARRVQAAQTSQIPAPAPEDPEAIDLSAGPLAADEEESEKLQPAEASNALSPTKLNKMNKAALVAYASETLGFEMDETLPKRDMLARISEVTELATAAA